MSGTSLLRDHVLPGFVAYLQRVETAMRLPSGEARWGIAGLREEVLVMFMGEAMSHTGWDVTYEPTYKQLGAKAPGAQRADLLARRADGGDELIVEARWWWRETNVSDVLVNLAPKLSTIPTRERRRRVALLFAAGALPHDAEAHSGWRWTTTEVSHDFESGVPPLWSPPMCCQVETRMMLPGATKPYALRATECLFGAALYELI